jgi:carbamoyl-phosphate synthase large subunit
MTGPFTGTIAVTGMNATDNPAPGVPVARALREAPGFAGRVIGLGYDPLDSGFYASGLLDGGGILPYPSLGSAALRHALVGLRDQFGIRALLPTLDSELRAVISLADDLGREGIGTCVPDLDALERVSKAQLPRLGAAAGLKIPESEALTTPDGLPKFIKKAGLPVVVKGPYYGAYVAHSEADAIASFRYFESTWGLPVIVQAFAEGDEYNVCALGDGQGNTIGAVAMRKLLVTDKGKGWAGVTVSNPHLLAMTEALIGALRWRGPMEVEAILDQHGGPEDVQIIEINPRFPAWVYLTAAAGQNLPFVCAQMAMGEPAPGRLPPYAAGRMFVRISLDQVADLDTFAQLSSTGRLARPAGAVS